MKTDAFVPDGFCGLFCASCPNYMASEKGDPKAVGASLCHGCKSDKKDPDLWCANCTLKACALEKGVSFCYECDEFPCNQLEGFKNDPNFPYHLEVYDYMQMIKTEGKDKWLKEMKKRWSCPSCGTAFDWWTTTCTKCGGKTDGYVNPNP